MDRLSKSRQALGRLGPVRTRVEVARLEQRVRDLEEEVRECRRHHHRTAELTDVVQALLVPLATRDAAEVERILADYSERL